MVLEIARIGVETCTVSPASSTSTTIDPPDFDTSTCSSGSFTSTNTTFSRITQAIQRRANRGHVRLNLSCGMRQVAPRSEVQRDGRQQSWSHHVDVMALRLLLDHSHLHHTFAAENAHSRQSRASHSQYDLSEQYHVSPQHVSPATFSTNPACCVNPPKRVLSGLRPAP